MAQGLHHWHHRDDSLGRARRLKAAADDIDRDKWPHTVVHTDNTLRPVGHKGQPILHTVEARGSSVGQLVIDLELILAAE